jgi:3-oxoacyl-(acyl-carrier-protein) synthase
MSQVLWKNIIIPAAGTEASKLFDEVFNATITNVKKIATETNVFKIPDPKALRSMSRASVLLSNLCMDMKDILAPYLEEDAFSVGIYCAVENGPIHAPSTKQINESPAENFVELYRKLRSPKMYLKQLPNLVPAQLGISLGIRGVMNVYTHSTQGSLQAMQQAEEDLWHGRVKVALVCSSNAFDDFLIVDRARKLDPRTLSEGVGAMLLKKNEVKTDWRGAFKKDPQESYGISDQIINYIKQTGEN